MRRSMTLRSTVGAVLLGLGLSSVAQAQPAYGAPFIEAMTWTEIRDAIAGGARIAIIPTGGTEQNGPHMVLGKHNYVVTHAAGLIAAELNALVAPTIQYVPEGDYNRPGFGDKPGVITLPLPAYELLLDAAVRSLQVHGFTDILLIGDSGGNQTGLENVAKALNTAWKGTGTRVYALTDYYQKGRVDLRVWLLEKHGLDNATVGSHAGTTDTSQMLYVFPQGIRRNRLAPSGGSPTSGVNGDPTHATAEIGKFAVDMKVRLAVEQYRALKASPQ